LNEKMSTWHLLEIESDKESEAVLGLSKPEGWLELTALVKELFGEKKE